MPAKEAVLRKPYPREALGGAKLYRVDLPGVIGYEPLGFLTAIGLLDNLSDSGYLSWDPADGHAILHCHRHSSVADIVAALTKRLDSIKDGQAIYGNSAFPIRRKHGTPDPLRIRPSEYQLLLERLNRKGGSHWFQSMVTKKAIDANGFCAINPLIGIRGKQTIGSFWYYPMIEVRQDPKRLLTEALTGWRRVEGSEGWLLDSGATYSMDPNLRTRGGSMAVPGATWLATLAVRKFGYTLQSGKMGRPVLPSGWFRVFDRDVFAWPLWKLPIDSITLGAVWNVGWGSNGWTFSTTRSGSLQVQISNTHGVAPPNGIHHTVDLDVISMHGAARSPQGVLTSIAIQTSRVPEKHHGYDAWKGWDWDCPFNPNYPA